jgi:hypothetical protein
LFSFANEHGISVPVNVSFQTDKREKGVRISGYELWKIDNGDLIAESKGHFDSTDYKRQLRG